LTAKKKLLPPSRFFPRLATLYRGPDEVIRGVGRFWRTNQDIRTKLGNPAGDATTIISIWQDWERGIFFIGKNEEIYAIAIFGYTRPDFTEAIWWNLTRESEDTDNVAEENLTTPSAPLPETTALHVQLEDPEGDVPEAYLDVTELTVSVDGEMLEAILRFRDLPEDLTFDRDEMPEGPFEYSWKVQVFMDESDDQADYVINAMYHAHDDVSAFAGRIDELVTVQVEEHTGGGSWSSLDQPASIEVDYEADTMTLRGQIPGIMASAQFGFWCWDAVTQSLDRLDKR
jgi:hypothetical protein